MEPGVFFPAPASAKMGQLRIRYLHCVGTATNVAFPSDPDTAL